MSPALHQQRHCPLRHGLAGAFTLLELLIGVVVFSLVLAAINGVLYGALHLRNKTSASIDEALPMQHALALMRDDLASIVPPGGLLSGVLQTTRTSTQGTTASAMQNDSAANQPGQGSPDFYTSNGIIDEGIPWAEIQKVSYRLLASTNGGSGRDLFRSVTRNLLPSLEDQPVLTPILGGVQGIYFFYHDGTQWQETWDSTTASPSLPQAIKVQILQAAEERTRLAPPPIELIVPLLVQGRTNQTSQTSQTPGGGL